jgi:hypothetical protein
VFSGITEFPEELNDDLIFLFEVKSLCGVNNDLDEVIDVKEIKTVSSKPGLLAGQVTQFRNEIRWNVFVVQGLKELV